MKKGVDNMADYCYVVKCVNYLGKPKLLKDKLIESVR